MKTKVIGESIPRLDAIEKVTGRAKFTADYHERGMLYAKVLRSPYPHAKIVRFNKSKAENLSGVRVVIGPDDVPPISISPYLNDQYVLCSRDKIVRYVGDPVAAVAAETIDIAEHALSLIEIDYEEIPAVFDGEKAFQPNPPAVVHPELLNNKNHHIAGYSDPKRPNVFQTARVCCGDLERSFQKADLVLKNRYTTARISHSALECHIADAWFESNGELTIRTPTQNTNIRQSILRKLFNLPLSKVRILKPYIGGAFGSKGGLTRLEPIAALLAQKSERPVRLSHTRQEDLAFGGHRANMIIDIKDAIKKNGAIIGRKIRVILVAGAYCDIEHFVVTRIPSAAIGTYSIPNFKIEVFGVYTNLPLAVAYRGFGAPEVQWAIEQQMDVVARKIGLDPIEIRKKNLLRKGDKDACGMIIPDNGLEQCLNKATEEKKSWSKKLTKKDGLWRRGIGVAIGNKSILPLSTSEVVVKVWQDGMIEVWHGSSQLGQGISTTLAQIAANEFGVPMKQIKVVSGDSAFCPYDLATISSRSLVHNGNALLLACQDAKQQLFKIATSKLGSAPKDLEIKNGNIFVRGTPETYICIKDLFSANKSKSILAKGLYTAPGLPKDPETGQSERHVHSYSYIANVVEVGVNIGTGEVKIIKLYSVVDVGKAINPEIVRGQIEGGVSMAVGSTIFEKIVFSKGVVCNKGFLDYQVPITMDIPYRNDFKTIIVEAPHQDGPFGAKGVGEVPTVAIAPAIANAVYNAIGIRIIDMPLSREKILERIEQNNNERGSL